MAIGSTTVWRIRVSGNNVNGAGFDSAISGAGTDYSQQDAAQLTLTDIVCAASTTVTSATGGFTAAMIGNAMRLTGTGVTTGYYFITARTDTNTITVDRNPAAGATTDGTGNVGGAAASPETAAFLNNGNAVGNKMVPGNDVYIRGSGTSEPGTSDYTVTSYVTPVHGDLTNGRIRIMGENGRPRIGCSGLLWYIPQYLTIDNIYFFANTSTLSRFLWLADNCVVTNCLFDLNDLNDFSAITIQGAGYVANNLFRGKSTRPTVIGNTALVILGSYGVTFINNIVKFGRYRGVSGFGIIKNNVIHDCLDNGIELTGGLNGVGGSCNGNIVYNNDGHGINANAALNLFNDPIYENIIVNHNETGKVGLRANAGTAALNDRIKIADYNVFHNNTLHYSANLTASANDIELTADPFVDAANGDFNINNDADGGADLRAVTVTLP